ncbi:Carbohydrate-binding WSC, subgroup [Metarhizium album ARSEF 1941]|uniref:Carbohydrate-binding WSC, subgroup n=1 Tax=Metarhizium album (strain ARSEF 1941) TaxID=1081103 RepID=A0A0B2WU06_METAS|nr:Carbohydrate-binding WSC, subgroup [Metarhizium album ARSEF 1941]KHN99556.1 Carbohydrate-binding WSC, subgroup [Metarhizium album ARSEF 1941]
MTVNRSALAAAAVALVSFTQAWNIELPPCVEPFKPFVYSGCFQDSNSNALVFRSSLDQKDMTVEKCIADCKGNGFRYAGLEYYGVCFCGATVNGAQLDESKCSFPCSGSKTEKCGGDKSLSVWQDPTFPKSPSDVTVDDYKSLGCQTDDSPKGRTLSYPANLDASTFTTKKCLAACEKQGFPFAGVEFGKECWCGVVLANDTAQVDGSQCNMPCQGDSSDTCGGRGRLNLWVAKDLESLEPCGHQPGTGTTRVPPVTTTTTKSVDTTTKPYTTTTRPETNTTTKPYTTNTKPETTTTKPYTTTTKPETTTTKPETTTTTHETPTAKPQTTTTTGETTTTTRPETTITTTRPGTTGTTTPETATTTPQMTTTTKPQATEPTTTTEGIPHTTTNLCTATVTLPPKCEWQCGSWCAPALPHWSDQNGCVIAQKTCHKQVSSCFKNAGWPGSVECFKFKAWCGFIDAYCASSCPSSSCGKWDCWNQHHGGSGKPPGNPPTTTTSVYPCPTTSTPASTTAKPATSCPPEPTNICTQPTSHKYGYGPGKPVGGIPLPVVGCNDCKDEFDAKPFKYYTEAESRNCPGFPWHKWPGVCSQACKEQYAQCVATYNKGCQTWGWRNGWHKRAGESDEQFAKRWSNWGLGSCAAADSVSTGAWSAEGSDSLLCWGWGGNKASWALERCKAQYRDCQSVNQWVDPEDKCQRWPGC